MDIPADMTEEILLRLPVKSLLRFKSVCSRWFSLIGSRSFAERHFRQGKNNHECRLLVDPDDDDVYEYYNHYPEDKVCSHILGPVKGVFCKVREDGTLTLSNPAMREIKTLPPLPILLSIPERIRIRALAFGFGYDHLTGAFKIVAFTKPAAFQPAACVVYNSTINSWKHLPAGCLVDAQTSWSHMQSRFLNGVYYWLLRSHNWKDAPILAFDMVTEEFRELIPAPDLCGFSLTRLCLAAYRDSLALMGLYQLGACRCVDLWVMVGKGWKYSFSVGPFQDMEWLLCLWSKSNTNRRDLFLETLDFSDRIPSDLSARMEWLSLERPSPDAKAQYAAILYKESLISIKEYYTDDMQIIGQNPNPSSSIVRT